jgi:hypothetical protein
MAKVQTVTVVNATPQEKDGGYRVAIHDYNDLYEGGELFIADGAEHTVPATAAVKAALVSGALREVGEGEGESDDSDDADDDDDDDGESEFTEKALRELTREKLNEIATGLDIDKPESFRNKDELITAILEAF